MTGSIPKALEQLRSLEELYLHENHLTGPIPTFLGKLTKLHLSNNQLSGPILESLGQLTGLTELYLDSNQLTCPIPSSLGRLVSLRQLSVSSNFLNGTIPISVGQLIKLSYFNISKNSIGVILEAHFAKLLKLKYLYITSDHKFVFNISNDWMPPFQLIATQLESCKITNGFPQWLQTQKKLQVMVLSNVGLYGLLPTWLQKMPMIMCLDLSHNKLHGSLVNLPFSEDSLYIALKDNLFNGSIPQSLCRSTHLVLVDISENRLSGNIPDCVENLQQLVMLEWVIWSLSGLFNKYVFIIGMVKIE